LPLADGTVDLIVTSPPYWGLRSYQDGGEHYDGQLGSEPSAREFLAALWAVTAECWRVLRPTGSMWVNLGDKRSGSGAPGTTSGLSAKSTLGPKARATPRNAPVQGDRSGITGGYKQHGFGRARSKMLLPHRWAIGCEDGHADPDGIGWIVRQDQVWAKPNGLPEPVKDRTRDSHEYWFHLAKEPGFYADLNPIRTPYADKTHTVQSLATVQGDRGDRDNSHRGADSYATVDVTDRRDTLNPLGATPRSVWSIATEPLATPDHLDIEHFAAFPTEWPRRLILGWSPPGICTECDGPRRSTSSSRHEPYRPGGSTGRAKRQDLTGAKGGGFNTADYPQTRKVTTITGEACDCPDATAPTRPAVVLDPFGGTGTTAMVARALGRHGITVDLSADYNQLATWRIFHSPGASRIRTRTNSDRQTSLFGAAS